MHSYVCWYFLEFRRSRTEGHLISYTFVKKLKSLLNQVIYINKIKINYAKHVMFSFSGAQGTVFEMQPWSWPKAITILLGNVTVKYS